MTHRSHVSDDDFEDHLRRLLSDHAAEGVAPADPQVVADAMLDARARRRVRVGLAGVAGVLAAAVLAGIAFGGLLPMPTSLGASPSPSVVPASGEASPSAAVAASAAPTPTPVTLPGQEAPEECGFPDGAALSFAGRSTTAALGVQEVVGDPMSDDPADIYITRDQYDQGELRGRLVCAIFPGDDGAPGFVEITVHPDDGGRFSPTPVPSSTPPPAGISRDDAVSVAHDLLPAEEGWEIRVVEAGPIGRVLPHFDGAEWAEDLLPDTWVWRVFLVRGDEGTDVVIDYVDGSIHGTIDYIVN